MVQQLHTGLRYHAPRLHLPKDIASKDKPDNPHLKIWYYVGGGLMLGLQPKKAKPTKKEGSRTNNILYIGVLDLIRRGWKLREKSLLVISQHLALEGGALFIQPQKTYIHKIYIQIQRHRKIMDFGIHGRRQQHNREKHGLFIVPRSEIIAARTHEIRVL